MLSRYRQHKFTSFQIRCCVLEGELQNPQSVKSWTEKILWFTHSTPHRELDRIDGEPVVLERKIFPGHTTVKLLSELQNMMEKELSVLPKDAKDRIIFMRMYNDIDWSQKDNDEICKSNSSNVAEYATDFPKGLWSLLGLGCQEKLYATLPEKNICFTGQSR